jgi:hypothetical protein
MNEKSYTIKAIVLLVLLIILSFPLLQAKFNFVHTSPLKGAVVKAENAFLNINDWFSGSYQERKEKYLNDNFGFRNIFIRINNQISFWFFKKAKANGVIIGRKNYLFEENYLKAYYGIDYIGFDSIFHRLQRVKFVQDTLKKIDKDLFLVFAAGKGSFYPEFFPRNYKAEKSTTNYETHIELAKQLGINFIDFNNHFLTNKSDSEYPLFPQYGIHWSHYGMCLAADSIVRFIENVRNIDMPNFYWDDVILDSPKELDYDIADGMNILFKLKSFKMAYPNIQFEPDSGKSKPSVLVISDSFYWGMFGSGIITRSFSENHFWFYNQQAFISGSNVQTDVDLLDLEKEISKHDVFIIMATEANLPNFGWSFIENTYDLFKGIKQQKISDAEFQERVVNLINYIKTDEGWLEQIRKKAKINNVSVDSMITLDAIWQIQHGN